ncbi:hypothetical protein EGJ45_04445 [Stutzerimonas stutzeri]|nr:hypothetical protein EGJ45_04445 [Stutzerimonas stutzeri]RRW26782.1 hypothetical protein EGJ36_04440 [Stutzerimonas stutzeri]
MVGIPEKGRTKLPEVVRAEQVDGKSTRGFGDFRAKKSVHRAFPGKAALIFRKKYSESRNP